MVEKATTRIGKAGGPNPDTFVAMEDVDVSLGELKVPADWGDPLALFKGNSIRVSVGLAMKGGREIEFDLVPHTGRPVRLYKGGWAE